MRSVFSVNNDAEFEHANKSAQTLARAGGCLVTLGIIASPSVIGGRFSLPVHTLRINHRFFIADSDEILSRERKVGKGDFQFSVFPGVVSSRFYFLGFPSVKRTVIHIR